MEIERSIPPLNDKKSIENIIGLFGFDRMDGETDIWKVNVNDYIIQVNLQGNDYSKWSILYGGKISVGRMTTCNFSNFENFVVLECVIRLLNQGYAPDKITLEKQWRVGGYLDILVKDDENKTYLMIECKTWGKEYNKAITHIVTNNENKEQVINYYLQDKNAKYLCVYSSRITSLGTLDYVNSIIPTRYFAEANNHQEIYDRWDKVFFTKGIFEENIKPYGVQFIGITKKDLKSIDHQYLLPQTNEDGSIFNRFAEILRRHSISDKSNAYNKIFNLFLCKIVDEDNAIYDNYEMEFQWKVNEDAETVIYRLSDLYKKGMKEYMNLDISDVSEEEFNQQLSLIIDQSHSSKGNILREMFKQLRLYKNNEFSFKEVINERTFIENAEIVKEVVKLLETYQIKYEHKQQFLGDFFERLLNIGVKQESGQFFTPIPITSFICNSIPFEEIIKIKINEKDNYFLPYVIDYACGSGHFLTDSIDRVDRLIQDYQETKFKTNTQKSNFISWKVSYKWAKEFIYGIEKDYRLAKTTKVACFLNGDGEANIHYADGLLPFNTPLYRGKLHNEDSLKEINDFDVVIANPPFSVENFKSVLKVNEDTFDLYNSISDRSDDIECLFVERTAQLLKEDGYAGIILPSTFLLNKGIQQKTRKLLLQKFSIYGLCELGTKTFTYAGQPTVVLFLKKRKTNDVMFVKNCIENFYRTKKDFTLYNVRTVIEKYISSREGCGSFNDYIKSINNESIWSIEREKLLIYLLNINSKVVIANSGEKDSMKEFLGYEHSSMTKYEGIHPYPYNEEGRIISKMTDSDDIFNKDKLSFYIYNNYLNKNVKIPENLEKWAKIEKINDIIDYNEENEFECKIYTQALYNPYLTITKYPLVLLDKSNSDILDNLRKPIKRNQRNPGKIPYYGATGITGYIDEYIFDEKLLLIGEDGANWGKGENTSYIITGKSWVNNHAHVIRTKNGVLLEEYLRMVINYLDFSYLKTRPNGGKLQKGDLIRIKFPLPTILEQKSIVNNCCDEKSIKWNKFEDALGICGV